MTAVREYGHIRAFDAESEGDVSSILTAVSDPRMLPRLNMPMESFQKLPDMTWRHAEIVPRTYHKRQLRCGTWIVEFTGTRNQDGTIIITSYRACIRVKAGSRPTIFHHPV